MAPRIDVASVKEAAMLVSFRSHLTARATSTPHHHLLARSALTLPMSRPSGVIAARSLSPAGQLPSSSSRRQVRQLVDIPRTRPAFGSGSHLLPAAHKVAHSTRSPSQAAVRLASTSSSSSPTPSPPSSSSSSSASQKGESSQSESDSSTEDPNPSFRQRMRYLWKRYGWWAFGVYNLWSLADFSLAWAVIHMFGAEHIRELETKVREAVGLNQREAADDEVAVWPLPGQTPAIVEGVIGAAGATKGGNNESAGRQAADMLTKGVDEATTAAAGKSKSKTGGSSTLWTEAVLAYTIHKTLLLPFRVMGTGALTPSFVKLMVRLGWAKPLPPAGTLSAVAKVSSSAANIGSTGARKAAKGATAAGKK